MNLDVKISIICRAFLFVCLFFLVQLLLFSVPMICTTSFCSVFTPYYSETVLYSKDELQKRNEDGISTLFYLQKIYPGLFTLPPLLLLKALFGFLL